MATHSIEPTPEEINPRIHQKRTLRVATTLATVLTSLTSAGVVTVVVLYRGSEVIGYIWPFAGMVGILLCLRAIGFVAHCLGADSWEHRPSDRL